MKTSSVTNSNEHKRPAAPYSGDGSAPSILAWAVQQYAPRLALACSFSVEDIAVLHMLSTVQERPRVFAIDTGRLNEETYECADAVRRHFKIEIDWVFPRHETVEKLEREKGLHSFRESLDNRRECCHIRKVEPLSRALAGLDAWITGMRREQSVTRAALDTIEADAAHGGMAKINPIAAWTGEQVWEYVRRHRLPYNRLHDRGYPSIGCAPCTRAVPAGEDPRSGRWWWEQADHKECGLHIKTSDHETDKRRT